jgi:hypothetical protein
MRIPNIRSLVAISLFSSHQSWYTRNNSRARLLNAPFPDEVPDNIHLSPVLIGSVSDNSRNFHPFLFPTEPAFNQPVQNTGLFRKQLLFKIPVPFVFGNPRSKGDQLIMEAACAAFKSQILWSVPRITGLWLLAMKILKVGTKLKYSP